MSLRPDLAERLDLVRRHVEATVMLSGSGPTVVGIVASQEEALESRAALLEAGLPVVHVATGEQRPSCVGAGRAEPKSSSLINPDDVTPTLPGLMSRCSTPCTSR